MFRLGAWTAAFAIWHSTPAIAGAGDCGDLIPSTTSFAETRNLAASDIIQLRDFSASSFHSPGLTAISPSPDGSRLAFHLRRADVAADTYCIGMFVLDLKRPKELRAVDLGGEMIRQVTTYFGITGHETGVPQPVIPHWSPDGRWIAFLKRAGGTTQVWRARADGGGGNQVTYAGDDVLDFAWTPDGKAIVFRSQAGIKAAAAAIRQEGDSGFHYDDRFAPVFKRRPSPRLPTPWQTFVAYLSDEAVRSAQPEEIALLDRTTEAGFPDNATLTAGRDDGARAWTMPFADDFGSEDVGLHIDIPGPTHIACAAPACVGRIVGLWWQRPYDNLLFLKREGPAYSQTALYRWRPGELPRRVLRTEALLADCSAVPAGLVCARETATEPKHLVLISPTSGKIQRLFDPNPEFAGLKIGTVERLHWKNSLGLESYGDLVLPPNHRPGERHPLVVVQYRSRGFLRGGTGDEYPVYLLAQRGFAVLSFDRPADTATLHRTANGVAFQKAGIAGWADRRSVLDALETGVRRVIAKGVVDPQRIGLTGLSDGASTVQFALVNSRMFAAAAMSTCCEEASSLALAGPSLLERWQAAGWPPTSDRADAFWKPFSLIRNADAISVPVLMQLADDEVLLALEAYSALRDRHQPVDLFVFPGEQHIKWRPRHRLAIYERNLDWFDFWLNGTEHYSMTREAEYAHWRRLRALRGQKP